MDDDKLDDLKQFIDGRMSQSETSLKTTIATEIKKAKTELSKQMTDGFAGVGDAIENINDQYQALDVRVTKLEERVAA